MTRHSKFQEIPSFVMNSASFLRIQQGASQSDFSFFEEIFFSYKRRKILSRRERILGEKIATKKDLVTRLLDYFNTDDEELNETLDNTLWFSVDEGEDEGDPKDPKSDEQKREDFLKKLEEQRAKQFESQKEQYQKLLEQQQKNANEHV